MSDADRIVERDMLDLGIDARGWEVWMDGEWCATFATEHAATQHMAELHMKRVYRRLYGLKVGEEAI